MVEYLDARIFPRALGARDFESFANRLLTHRRMRSEGDEHVERLCSHTDLIMQGFEHEPNGCRASAIGHDQQNPFVAIVFRRTNLLDELLNGIRADAYTRRRRS